MHILSSLGAFLVVIAGWLGYNPSVGATLPSATAIFETSLAAPITSSATSLTLATNSVRGGGALSGYNCFTVDEGSAQAETLCGTVSSTAVSDISRGISQSTGTTTVAALQFAHRRGANVKITDFPLIQILKAQNNGEDTFPRLLNYTYSPDYATASTTAIVSYGLLQQTSFAGTVNADEATKGIVELGTALEAASSSSSGTAGRTVLTTRTATDTPQAACASGFTASGSGCTVVASLTGKIKNAWLDLTSSWVFSGPVSIAATGANTLSLNGVAYTFPSSGIASSTTFGFDASGNATYVPYHRVLYSSGTPVSAGTAAASTTVFITTIPANALKSKNIVRVTGHISDFRLNNNAIVYVDIGFGSASSTYKITNSSGSNYAVGEGNFEIDIVANGSTSSQELVSSLSAITNGLIATNNTTARGGIAASYTQDTTAAKQFTMIVREDTNAAGCTVVFDTAFVELLTLQ